MFKKLAFALLAAFALTTAVAEHEPVTAEYDTTVDFEVGYELDSVVGNAFFIYATTDIEIIYLSTLDSSVWLSPSVELELRNPIEGFVQAQALFDTPLGTLSGRLEYDIDDGSVETRVGYLFSF